MYVRASIWRVGLGAIALASAITAFGPGPTSAAAAAAGSTTPSSTIINVSDSPAGPLEQNFNPFSTSDPMNLIGGTYLINEPLFITDPLRPSDITPWLATGWSFNTDDRALTVNLHSGITWSDGEPFSASDVAFTFNLLVKYPALNSIGLPVTSARAITPNQVQITFSSDASTDLAIVGEVPIVPEHIWSAVANPVTYTNPDPVGTGPYMLSKGSFSSQSYLLVKNPRYWQKDRQPKIAGFRFITYDSNTSANLALENGQLDWAGNFVPEIQKTFTDRSSANHYWFPTSDTSFLCPNDSLAKYKNVDVRKAIQLALNLPAIAKGGEQGEEPPATNPTGLTLPADQPYLSPAYAHDRSQPNPKEAKTLLERAGYHLGAGGVMTNAHGQPLTVTLNVPSSFTDTLADFQIVAQELDDIGIKASVDATSESEWIADLVLGHTDMTMCESSLISTISTPYQVMQVINGNAAKPVGQLSLIDTERYINPTADALLQQYATSTSKSVQKRDLNGLEQIMVQQVPVIPFIYGVSWDEYTTVLATGWPSAADPYASGSPIGPSMLEVALHLKPVKSR